MVNDGYYIDNVGIKTVIPSDIVFLNLYNKNLVEIVCNSELEKLWCSNNQLTKLTLNDKLEVLSCDNNQLTNLILNDNLMELTCDLRIKLENINNNTNIKIYEYTL